MNNVESFVTESMSLENRVAYLQGMSATLAKDDSEQAKVVNALIRTVRDVVDTMSTLVERLDQVETYLDDLDEDLENLEETVYETEDIVDDFQEENVTVSFAEIPCPNCGIHFFVDHDFWQDKSMVDMECPNCHESLAVSEDVEQPSRAH